MKKLFCVFISVLLALSCVVSAGADVIFEPRDSFYETHRDKCEYHDRSYTANGPNGELKVYESPESDRVCAVVPNGEELYICFVYQDGDGILWGITENWETELTGWVPMDYLELIYDEVSFLQEHENELVEEAGELAGEFGGKTVRFWEYPGSTRYYEVWVEGDYLPQYQTVYVDPCGNRWGRVGYYMAMRGWISLDAPGADYDTLYPDVPEQTLETEAETVPSQPEAEIVPKPAGDMGLVLILAGSVLAVVAVTAVLLVVLLKRK